MTAAGARPRAAGRAVRAALAAALLALPAVAAGTGLQIRDRDLRYEVLETEHFEVFFTDPALLGRVRTMAAWAEEQYATLRMSLAFDPVVVRGEKIPLFVYASLHEFHQWPVGPVEGALGVTHFFQDRVALPLLGSPSFTREVLRHELMHAFQIARYIPDPRVGWNLVKMGVVLPFWYVEGGADHRAVTWSATDEMLLREAVLSGNLRPMSELTGAAHFNPHEIVLRYKQGALFHRFLEERHGEEALRRLFHVYAQEHLADDALVGSVGRNLGMLDAEFRAWARERYAAQAAGRRTVSESAVRRTFPEGLYWTWNREPAVSPDGTRIAYLSDPRQRDRLQVLDRSTGTETTLLTFPSRRRRLEAPTPSSASRHPEGRALAWSPDGTAVAFLAEWGNRTVLAIVEADPRGRRTRLRERIEIPYDEAYSPAWMPDGRSIVMSVQRRGATDLARLDLASGSWEMLTDDPHHDNAPAVHPDGGAIAYVSERAGQRDLFLLSLPDRSVARLTRTASEELSPAWTADGRSLLYSSDASGGIFDLWIHDPDTGRRAPLTRIRGGAFTPCPVPGPQVPDSSRVAFAGYEAGRYDLYETDIPAAPAWEPVPQDVPPEDAPEPAAPGEPHPYRREWHLDTFFPLGVAAIASASDRTGEHSVVPFAAALADGLGDSSSQAGIAYRNAATRRDLMVAAGGFYETRNVRSGWTNRRATYAEATASDPLTPYLAGSLGLLVENVADRAANGLDDRETRTAVVAGLDRGFVTGHGMVPTEGDRLFARGVAYTEDLGGQRDELRTDLAASRLLPLPLEDHHLQGRIHWTRVRGADAPDDALRIGGSEGGLRGFGGEDIPGTDRVVGSVEYGFPIRREINWDPEMMGFLVKDVRGALFWDTGGIGRRVNRSEDVLEFQSVGAALQVDAFVYQKLGLRTEIRLVRQVSTSDGWNLELGFSAGL